MYSKTEKPDPVKQWITENMSTVLSLTECVITDVFNRTPRYKQIDFERDISTLRRRTQSEGLTFISSTMPNLMKEFLLSLETGIPLFTNFKIKRGTVYPTFLHGLFRLTVDEVCGVDSFASLYQILVGFKKLKGPYSTKVLQEEEDKFVATDQSLIYESNHFNDLILETAAGFIGDVFSSVEQPGYIEDNFSPRPGPGATNTALHHYERFSPHNLRDVEMEKLIYDWFYVNHTYLHDDHKNISNRWKDGYHACKSRFKFVHKTLGKPRGICIEENEMQYMQQGLKALLYNLIERHPVTTGRINFSSQGINQKLALEASATRDYCTIDMSEASDRISRELVNHLFKYTPTLLSYLNTLSTKIITMPKGDINCNKFSPMGSGICFPVMSIVHWSLIRAMIYLSVLPDTYMNDFYVYGDDLIVPNEAFEVVTTLLPRFGMKINVNKSFSKSFFRESCGVDALRGVKVTPVYFKYIPRDHQTVEGLLSIIAVEYQLHKRYPITASFLREKTKVTGFLPVNSPPLSWKRDSVFDHSCYKVRYAKKVQSLQYRVQVAKPVRDDDSDSIKIRDDNAYLRWHLMSCRNHDDQWAHQKLKLKWVWMPYHKLMAINPDLVKKIDKVWKTRPMLR